MSEAEAILYMDAVKRILEEDSEAARRSGDNLKIKGTVSRAFLFTNAIPGQPLRKRPGRMRSK